MKKILSFILGSIFALNLSISVANSAANEVRVAYFLEWPSPNLEDMMKKNYSKALGVPVKWTSFNTGVEMTEAMLAGDIDISYSCLLYTSPSPRDGLLSRMPSSA